MDWNGTHALSIILPDVPFCLNVKLILTTRRIGSPGEDVQVKARSDELHVTESVGGLVVSESVFPVRNCGTSSLWTVVIRALIPSLEQENLVVDASEFFTINVIIEVPLHVDTTSLAPRITRNIYSSP